MSKNKPFETDGNIIQLPWDEVTRAINYWLNEVVFQEPVHIDAIDTWKEDYEPHARGLSIEFSRLDVEESND